MTIGTRLVEIFQGRTMEAINLYYQKQTDVCQFVAHLGGLFEGIVPQPFWHIQKTGGLPGHICDTFCGDTGYIHRQGYVTIKKIRHRLSVELCLDCLDELYSRLEAMVASEETVNETCRPEENK